MRRIFEPVVLEVTGGRRNHMTRPNVICVLQLIVSESIKKGGCHCRDVFHEGTDEELFHTFTRSASEILGWLRYRTNDNIKEIGFEDSS
jgi:hypothetical protein